MIKLELKQWVIVYLANCDKKKYNLNTFTSAYSFSLTADPILYTYSIQSSLDPHRSFQVRIHRF